MGAAMAWLGAAALGLVFGWLAILVARSTDGRLRPGAREACYFAFSLLNATAVAYAYVGRPGLIAAAIGFGLGAVAGTAALARPQRDVA
jgi:hypothetical protein